MQADLAADEFIYRAMLEDNGFPTIRSTAVGLGVRKNRDIEVDQQDRVHLPKFHPQGMNGLSCSPSVAQLPFFAKPRKWGGTNKKTEAWAIKVGDLGSDLVAGRDGTKHISIGPSKTMMYDDYVKAIEDTVTKWIKIEDSNGD